jgi:hypothetical protein
VLSCRDLSRMVSDGLERRLAWWERLVLGAHLLTCRPCRHFCRAVRWLHASLPSAPSDARLAPAARARIQRALEEAAGGS